jgi:hypothetical protein
MTGRLSRELSIQRFLFTPREARRYNTGVGGSPVKAPPLLRHPPTFFARRFRLLFAIWDGSATTAEICLRVRKAFDSVPK